MACHDRFTSRAFKTMCFVNLTITLSAGMTYWLPTNSQSVIIEWIDGNLNKSDGNDNFNSTVEYQESDQALNIFALILGLQTWMSLFGAIPAMYISETKGPKFTITLAAVLQITFQTLTFLSLEVFDSLPTYFACQIIIGINLGIITTILPAYNSEISKLQDRAFFSSLFTFFLKFGGLLILFLGIEPVLGNRERVSYMYLVPVVPALIYLVFVFLVVESPAFYAKKRDFVKVREIVSKLYGNCEVEMDIDMDPLDPGQQDASRTNVSTFQALKTYFTNKPLLRSTFYFSLVTTLSVFAAPNEVTRYSNRILASFGFSKLLNQLTTAGIFSFFVFVTIPASFLIDKWRRRVQLISNAVILGISMSVLTVLGQLDDQENLVRCPISGLLGWILPGEVVSSDYNNIAFSFNIIIWFGWSGILQYIFPLIFKAWGSYAFLVFVTANVVLGIYFYFYGIDTEGKSGERNLELFGEKSSIGVF